VARALGAGASFADQADRYRFAFPADRASARHCSAWSWTPTSACSTIRSRRSMFRCNRLACSTPARPASPAAWPMIFIAHIFSVVRQISDRRVGHDLADLFETDPRDSEYRTAPAP